MKFLSTLLLFVLTLVLLPAIGQSTLSTEDKKAIEMYKAGDNYRVRFQYKEAVDLLSRAIDRDKKFFEAYLRLGVTYKSMGDFDKAREILEAGLRVTPELRWQKAFWVELAENGMQRADYRTTAGYSEQYLQNETINKQRIDQMRLMKASAEFSLQNIGNEIEFNAHSLSDTVNYFLMQYFPVVTADEQQLIYTRRLGPELSDDEDIVISVKDKNGNWTKPESISDKINTKYNEGTCTISADGRHLIFTSCFGRNGNCDLFESRKTGNNWSTPKSLGAMINTPAWESQPSLSADGRLLYFVSDRRGGLGMRDIYVSFQHELGVWSRAQNLGPVINTPNNEHSPYIHVSGKTLFFASDGRPGFGGYDVYSSDLSDSTWAKPVNFGYPINNHQDQYSLVISADGQRGYYAHEDIARHNSSKIYEFSVPEAYRVKYRSNVVTGVVRDKVTRQPLQASIELFGLEKNELISFVNSDSVTGQYLIVLTQGADYGLYASSGGYLFKSLNFNYEAETDFEPLVIDIDLDKASAGASMVLKNIFFDLDKFDLRPKSISELNKLVSFMELNPAIKIEVSGHTDDQGKDTYNQQLSEKRAKAVGEYLLGKGIAAARMKEIGYGSKRPLKPNDSEDNRQVNRRIECRVIN